MSADTTDADEEGPVYSYRPTLAGRGWTFRLGASGIDWSGPRRSGHVPFRNVRRVRMSFKPTSLQSHRYQTELWAEDSPKLTIQSSSWKSMVEHERLDSAYSAFIAELHRRLAQAGGAARFSQGLHPLIYWPGLAVFVALLVAMAAVMVRALQTEVGAAVAFIGIFLAFFLWQGFAFFRRNRPGRYRPEEPPEILLPTS